MGIFKNIIKAIHTRKTKNDINNAPAVPEINNNDAPLQSNTNDKESVQTIIEQNDSIIKTNSQPEIDNSEHHSKDIDIDKDTSYKSSSDPHLNSAVPSSQGLYPHEILMLSYAHTYKLSGNNFQNFWYDTYSVADPQKLLISLYERGFITLDSLKTTIERLKVTDLKEELQNIGAKTTGKKAELVDRLLELGNIQILEQKYPDRYFTLTEKGQQEINANEYVMYLHKSDYMSNYISISDMNYLLHRDDPSHPGYRDILWNILNSQCEEQFTSENFGSYRDTRFDMYRFLMEENKYKMAFQILCEVVAYNLSGLENGDNIFSRNPADVLQNIIEIGFPYSNSIYTLPPFIVGCMSQMQALLQLSETDFRNTLLENFKKISLKRRIFTAEECVEILINEIEGHPRKLAAIYSQAEKRLREELDSIK